MISDPRRAVRCAIYTRKSSEEGLEMSFNSLHAGIRHARACGKQLGRARRIVSQDELVRLKCEGHSLREIAKRLRVGYGTVRLRLRKLNPKM
jgi:DNA invertase Pin-like site-specific DNA recombinase